MFHTILSGFIINGFIVAASFIAVFEPVTSGTKNSKVDPWVSPKTELILSAFVVLSENNIIYFPTSGKRVTFSGVIHI